MGGREFQAAYWAVSFHLSELEAWVERVGGIGALGEGGGVVSGGVGFVEGEEG